MVLAQALNEVRLGLHVQQMVEAYNCDDKPTLYQSSEKLVKNLVELGYLPDDSAFIEYQGVAEFGLAPVCYFPEGASEPRWFNVNVKGEVLEF